MAYCHCEQTEAAKFVRDIRARRVARCVRRRGSIKRARSLRRDAKIHQKTFGTSGRKSGCVSRRHAARTGRRGRSFLRTIDSARGQRVGPQRDRARPPTKNGRPTGHAAPRRRAASTARLGALLAALPAAAARPYLGAWVRNDSLAPTLTAAPEHHYEPHRPRQSPRWAVPFPSVMATPATTCPGAAIDAIHLETRRQEKGR